MISRFAWWLAAGLLSLAVIASIWDPYFAHLYEPTVIVRSEVASAARDMPAKDRLEEIARQDAVMQSDDDLVREPVRVADELLQGRLTTGVEKPIELHKPFAPEDVSRMPPQWQLWFYGFAAPELYLKAYARSGNVAFLAAARDYILAWKDYEAKQWKPEGDLWGEHAVAQRAHVLIAFWLAYRHAPIFDLATAQGIIGYAEKCGRMLADPGLYVFRTNHGVMQNLALLQLSLAFPTVDALRPFADLAHARLSQQLPHYVNEEGAILEHSAGYQEFGVRLLGPILRDLALLGKSAPQDWPDRYEKAVSVYATLRRPDGSLPRWGDTTGDPDPNGPAIMQFDEERRPTPVKAPETWRPSTSWMLLPGAGTVTWWNGIERWPGPAGLSQTFVTWSYYPPLGHKHADELGVMTWANGRSWWTSEGYLDFFPFGIAIDSPWDGSNAPHLTHEAFNEKRRSHLLAFANADRLRAVELERHSDDGFTVHRQVIQAGPDLWLIIDGLQDSSSRTAQTVWTADPGLLYQAGPDPSSFRLVDPAHHDALDVTLLGSPAPRLAFVQGSYKPFLGWTSDKLHAAVPTSAIVVEQPSPTAWAMNISVLRDTDDEPMRPARVLHWDDAEHWSIVVPGSTSDAVISRAGATITRAVGQDPVSSAELTPAPDVSPSSAAVLTAYARDVAQYGGPMRDLWFYRVRMSLVLLFLICCQQLTLGLVLRRWAAAGVMLSIVSLAGWTGMAAWLWFVYF